MHASITLDTADLINLVRTATPITRDGDLQFVSGGVGLYLHATPDELAAIAAHFTTLAVAAADEVRAAAADEVTA